MHVVLRTICGRGEEEVGLGVCKLLYPGPPVLAKIARAVQSRVMAMEFTGVL